MLKDLITFKTTQNEVFLTPGIDLGGAQVIAYAWVRRRLKNHLCLGWAAPNQSPMLIVSHENGHNFLLGYWIKEKFVSLES